MKQIIMDVLNDMSHSQVNLGSNAARKMVSTLISTALKSKGCYTEYDDSEIEEQNARATWVCSICGKNTADVDYDYIGSGTNHLGCELEIDNKAEIDPKDDADYYTGPEPIQTLDDGKDLNFIHGSEEIDGAYTAEEFEEWEEAVKELSEEIVDNKDKEYIYESPDSGKTIFKRKVGEDKRELVTNWDEVNKNEG
jgi:hypothetical protein